MKALLIIDTQKGLTIKRNVYNLQHFILTINKAIDDYREAGFLIVFVQHNNKILPHGEPDWEIDDRIHFRGSDLVIQKHHGDAFKKTALNNLLKDKKVTEILACGLTSHGCVKATCIGGLKNGYKTSLLKQGHSNVNKDANNKILLAEETLKELGIEAISHQK
jgi:nicotinamidase-related amidase